MRNAQETGRARSGDCKNETRKTLKECFIKSQAANKKGQGFK